MIKKTFLLVLLVFSAFPVWAEKYYYIYKDARGKVHIEDFISADHARYGYRVVNSQGLTIEVVPSSKEKQRQAEKQRKKAQKALAANKDRKADDFLLKTFIDANEIREAGNKKILAIQSEIDMAQNHIKVFEKNLRQLEAQLEKTDQAGKAITQKDVDAIRKIKESIRKNKAFIDQKKQQQMEIRDLYTRYIKRYRQLKTRR